MQPLNPAAQRLDFYIVRQDKETSWVRKRTKTTEGERQSRRDRWRRGRQQKQEYYYC